MFWRISKEHLEKPLKVLTTEDDVGKFSDGSGATLKDAPVFDLVDVTVYENQQLRSSIFVICHRVYSNLCNLQLFVVHDREFVLLSTVPIL